MYKVLLKNAYKNISKSKEKAQTPVQVKSTRPNKNFEISFGQAHDDS